MSDKISKQEYKFVTNKNHEQVCIAIHGGFYDGVIYKYGTVQLPDESKKNSDGTLNLKFEYDIVDSNGLTRDLIEKNGDFYKIIGDILMDIVINESNN
tara:strand:+ start:747 stop:1040 length:294 start_codon:yes stop_codon:yes gene_type:complete